MSSGDDDGDDDDGDVAATAETTSSRDEEDESTTDENTVVPRPATSESEYDSASDMSTLLADLPERNMLSRVEPLDLSSLFSSDTETVPAVWSPASSPNLLPIPREQLAETEDVQNFSMTARKGSSSNASPMPLRGAEASSVGPFRSTPVELPTRTQRELRRLQSFNTPGLRETAILNARRTRRQLYANLDQDDEVTDQDEQDPDDGNE